ncbi:helix-turn-helix domain-containing protein [Solidesulfovibrio sp.]
MKSRIDELARLKGLRMDELAEASGLSVVTVRKARRDGETGIDTLTLKNLQKIARALGLRPKDLFDDAD